MTRADLLMDGMTRRGIDEAVRVGDLIRARRDRYLPAGTPEPVVRAVRVGGRLTCLSLLQLLGVFVFANAQLHVHLPPTASRMRSPHDRRRRFDHAQPSTRLHWLRLGEDPGSATCVGIIDALAQAVLCQAPPAAVASIDSALNLGLIAVSQVVDIFARLPAKYAVLRSLVDGRAQSGPETLVRLMLWRLGCSLDLQVEFAGVGFVDLLVDGWLVVECDSEAYHGSWAQKRADYRRDLRLAQRGYVVIRLIAEDILYRPDEVLVALRGTLAAHGHRAGEKGTVRRSK